MLCVVPALYQHVQTTQCMFAVLSTYTHIWYVNHSQTVHEHYSMQVCIGLYADPLQPLVLTVALVSGMV